MFGNNFKLRSLLILFVVSSIFLFANFVSAATYDATGGWNLSISNGWTDGGDNCPIEVDETIPVFIIQDGDSFILIAGVGFFSGSITDNNYNITSYFEPYEENEVTVSGGFTLSSSTSGTGQIDASITEGAITCDKGMDIDLSKQGAAPTYNATGDWNFTRSNLWAIGPPGCDPDVPGTDTVTITQNGNDVTLIVHDAAGDQTFNGSVNGNSYIFKEVEIEGGETTTIIVTFTLSNENSGSGQVGISWTDGIEECIQGFDIAFTKQGSTNNWVNIKGTVTYNGTPLCAMVLANGQYMFSCGEQEGLNIGDYELFVPLDVNGEITLFAFVDGLAPFKVTSEPSSFPSNIEMQLASPDSKTPTVTVKTNESIDNPGWINIGGSVSLGGIPLCAMVLANGQYMFSCSGDGSYSLDVPLDANGEITLFTFVDGLQPYKRLYSP